MQQARLLLRRAVIGQDLRGAAESAPKRFVGDTSKMPAMRLAVDIRPPLRRPAKRVIVQLSCPIRIASAPSTGPNLDLCARQIVVASLLYYRHDQSFITDGEFDKMCRRVSQGWTNLSPLRKLMLGSADAIRASGFHVKVTAMAEDAAHAWMQVNRVKPSDAGRIKQWTLNETHRLHVAGLNSRRNKPLATRRPRSRSSSVTGASSHPPPDSSLLLFHRFEGDLRKQSLSLHRDGQSFYSSGGVTMTGFRN